MEVNKILSADIIDIIFEGRNKAYGAYELRKTYSRRMVTALLVTIAILLLSFVSYKVANKMTPAGNQVILVKDIKLEKIKPDDVKMTPLPMNLFRV